MPEDQEKKALGQVTISTIHAAKGLEWPVVFIPAVYEGSIPIRERMILMKSGDSSTLL